MLEEKKARNRQVALFREIFGEEAEVTVQNAFYAIEKNLDLSWVVIQMLSSAAQEEYYRAIAPAREEYDRTIAPAQEEYDRAAAKAFAKAWSAEHD